MNINDEVKVTLTKDAFEFLSEERPGILDNLRISDNVLTIQLWQLMYIFGSQMYSTNTRQMFEQNEITLTNSLDNDLNWDFCPLHKQSNSFYSIT